MNNSFYQQSQKIKQQTQGKTKKNISLKGLKQLITEKNLKKQNDELIEMIKEDNKNHIILVKGQVDQRIKENNEEQTSIFERSSQIMEQKNEEFSYRNNKEPICGQYKLMMVRTQQMAKNYNDFGNVLYYEDIVQKKGAQDGLNLKVGIIYGYTFEIKMSIFATYYVTYPQNQRFDNYVLLLLIGLIRMNNQSSAKRFRNQTFFCQNFYEIQTLNILAHKYIKDINQQQDEAQKVGKYHFLINPSKNIDLQMIIPQEIQQKVEIVSLLKRLLETPYVIQFNQICLQLTHIVRRTEIAHCKIDSEHNIAWFIDILIKFSSSICLSQITANMGLAQLFFKHHQCAIHQAKFEQTKVESERNKIIKNLKLSLDFNYSNIEQQRKKRILEQKNQKSTSKWSFSSNVSILIYHNIFNDLVEEINQQNIQIIAKNKELIQKNYFKNFEDVIPALAFIKYEVSKVTYDLLIKQTIETFDEQIRNDNIYEQIEKYPIQVQEKDDLLYHNNIQIDQKIYKMNFDLRENRQDEEYFRVVKNNRKLCCDCSYFEKYGLPCRHEIKMCILSKNILKNQISEIYLKQNYYSSENGGEVLQQKEVQKEVYPYGKYRQPKVSTTIGRNLLMKGKPR